jgi:hypothetical protein
LEKFFTVIIISIIGFWCVCSYRWWWKR